MIEDYLDDLAKYSPADVEYACRKYRQDPENKFFPKSGELIGILTPKRAVWDTPPSKLPVFRSPPALTGPKPKLRSVAEILRESGHTVAAERWKARTGSSSEPKVSGS